MNRIGRLPDPAFLVSHRYHTRGAIGIGHDTTSSVIAITPQRYLTIKLPIARQRLQAFSLLLMNLNDLRRCCCSPFGYNPN
jgi:hypothetical protein